MGLLDSQTTQPGLLSSGTTGSQAQKWANALAVMSAGLKDAGAWLQHDPAAAGNVAALARQHAGLQPANANPSLLAALSPAVVAALVLHAAQRKAALDPGMANQTGSQPGAGQTPAQNAPAPMFQPTATQLSNPMPTAQTLPAQNPGWGVQKVR